MKTNKEQRTHKNGPGTFFIIPPHDKNTLRKIRRYKFNSTS